MFEMLYNHLDTLLGLKLDELAWNHMVFRAFFVYILVTLIILFNRRFIVERFSFDIFIKFIMGSALASTIIGEAPYFATIIMILFIVFLDWFLSLISFHNTTIEKILTGKVEILYEKHKIQWKKMKRYNITHDDLLRALRHQSQEDFKNVDKIFFEKNGEITVTFTK